MGKSPDALTLGAITSQLKNEGQAFSPRDAMLSWMQEIAPYGVFTTDATLRIQSWNHWLATNSGFPAEAVIGKQVVEIFPDVQTRRLDNYYHRALQGEISVLSTALHKYLLPFPGREGAASRMLQTARIAPLPSAQGITGTITLIEDVTEREYQSNALQRQQEHDRVLSRALELLLRSTDPLRDSGSFFPELGPSLGLEAFFNHRFREETGTLELYTASGVLPKYRELMSSLELGRQLCGQAAVLRRPLTVEHLQQSTNPHVEIHRALGLRFYCCFPLLIADRLLGTVGFGSYSADTIQVDEMALLARLAQYLSIAMDRTQREQELRKAQTGLQEHAETLEAKVNERTARLHDTIAQLESFSYTVAHDLRAPIRALKGYCEVLNDDFSQNMSGDGHMILSRLHRASNRLDALTRDLLKFSKIGRQEVLLTKVNVDELIEELLLVTPALEKVVHLTAPLGTVHAQRTLLQQCLSNLFDNAVKFKKPSEELRITVTSERVDKTPAQVDRTVTSLIPATINRLTQQAGLTATPETQSPQGYLRIWVADNGIGIPPGAESKIFGIFERGAGLDHVEGTGIGLAIVARAMQQLNGSCGVESELGRGSRFWLELRAAD